MTVVLKEFTLEREVAYADLEYLNTLARGVADNADDLRARISPLLDRDFDQLDPVERAVLWLGAYELEYQLEVPWRVVLDQSVELAKLFGATDGHRFVNGVLDKLVDSLPMRTTERQATQRA